MELKELLLSELTKANENPHKIEFTLNDKSFTFYYKYLTLLQKVRIEQMCIKPVTTIGVDGVVHTKQEKQDHLIPIHTILEKAIDEEGKLIFSHTNPNDFKMVSSFPAALASYIAYEMSRDIFGSMDLKKKDE